MNTVIYMVRHGDSPKEGNERTRELTEKGLEDAKRVTDLLKSENINAVVSSPYLRSILTVQGLANHIGQEVVFYEDLKERRFSSDANRVTDKELAPLLKKSFTDWNYSLDGGESNAECQKRAIKVLQELLTDFRGKKIVIGSHGAVMTLMMRHYDQKYDLDFLHSTSKPDIYRMEFADHKLVDTQRLWDGEDIKYC